jgi:hypothetical protein
VKSIAIFFQSVFCWWDPRGQIDLSPAQIILTQAASDMADGSSSTTNRLLAQAAKEYHEKLGLPIFAQGEVARVLDTMGVPVVGRTPREAIPDNFGSKQYQGTSGVALLQKRYCDEHGLTRALVLAGSPHTWRARWTYEKLGLTVLLPRVSPRMVYEKGMNQKRWSSAWRAIPYEFSARMLYLFKGI